MDQPSPEFFSEDNIEMVNFQIGQLAIDYSTALEIHDRYKKQNDPDRKAALLDKALENPELKQIHEELTEMLGAGIMDAFVGEMVVKDIAHIDSEPDVTKSEFDDSVNLLLRSKTDLIDLVGFLYDNGVGQISRLGFCDTESEAQETAWRGVWSRCVNTIRPIGGVVLADIADLFDALVEIRYASYDPVDPYRGREAREDISARTFYDVFAPHLNRAITRSGEDGWTGH